MEFLGFSLRRPSSAGRIEPAERHSCSLGLITILIHIFLPSKNYPFRRQSGRVPLERVCGPWAFWRVRTGPFFFSEKLLYSAMHSAVSSTYSCWFSHLLPGQLKKVSLYGIRKRVAVLHVRVACSLVQWQTRLGNELKDDKSCQKLN